VTIAADTILYNYHSLFTTYIATTLLLQTVGTSFIASSLLI